MRLQKLEKEAEKEAKAAQKDKMMSARARGDVAGAAAVKAELAGAAAAKLMSSAEAFMAEQMAFIDGHHRHNHRFYTISRRADWKGEDAERVHDYLMGSLRFRNQPKDAPGEKDINLYVGDCTYKWWNGKIEMSEKKGVVLEVHPSLLKKDGKTMSVVIPDGAVVAVRVESTTGHRIAKEAGSLAYGAAAKMREVNIHHLAIVAVISPEKAAEYLAQNTDESRLRCGIYDIE